MIKKNTSNEHVCGVVVSSSGPSIKKNVDYSNKEKGALYVKMCCKINNIWKKCYQKYFDYHLICTKKLSILPWHEGKKDFGTTTTVCWDLVDKKNLITSKKYKDYIEKKKLGIQ